MEAASTPAGWTPDVAATAVVQLIIEQLAEITNPRWRAAAEAALRLPADQYEGAVGESLTRRWIKRAELDDHPDPARAKESYRGYWLSCAQALAAKLEAGFERMAQDPASWDRFAKTELHSPPRSLPISFDRTDVLYKFSGKVGIQSTSYRWLTAHDPVNHYDAVGWYFNEPNAPVEIVPLANCEVTTSIRDLPTGGRTTRLDFARTLEAGEKYFFAYSTLFNSSQQCRPTILYEVRGLHMNVLSVRAQFDRTDLPALCWFFNVEAQDEGWQEPEPDAPEVLPIASNGYVEHEFSGCRRGRKYGIRWLWN
jgi:hypothetical protein